MMNHKKQVTGYQIFCGSHLLQRVRSASRTKALLHGTCHVIIIIIGVVIIVIVIVIIIMITLTRLAPTRANHTCHTFSSRRTAFAICPGEC